MTIMAPTVWRQETESLLIDLYKENSCLWDIHHEGYHNKHKRKTVLERISSASFNGEFTVEDLKKKWISLTTIFRREAGKIKQSERSGARVEDIYIPTWVHFEEMKFMLAVQKSRNSITSSKSADTEPENDASLYDAVHYLVEMENDASSHMDSCASPAQISGPPSISISLVPSSPVEGESHLNTCVRQTTSSDHHHHHHHHQEQSGRLQGGSRKRKNDAREVLLEKAIAVLRSKAKLPTVQNPPQDDVQHFSNFMAATLRNMPSEKRNKTIAALGRLLFDEMST